MVRAYGVAIAHRWGTRPARYGRTGALTCGDAFRRTLLEKRLDGFPRIGLFTIVAASADANAVNRP